MLFCEFDDELKDVKILLKEKDPNFQFEIEDLKIDNNTQFFLGYLFIQQFEKNNIIKK